MPVHDISVENYNCFGVILYVLLEDILVSTYYYQNIDCQKKLIF